MTEQAGSMSANLAGAAVFMSTPPITFAIPEAAGAEIKRLHADVVEKHRTFDTARAAFAEFIRSTKRILGVPDDKPFDIADDASAFVELKGQ